MYYSVSATISDEFREIHINSDVSVHFYVSDFHQFTDLEVLPWPIVRFFLNSNTTRSVVQRTILDLIVTTASTTQTPSDILNEISHTERRNYEKCFSMK